MLSSPPGVRGVAEDFLRGSCGDVNEEEYLCEGLAHAFLVRLKCRKDCEYF